MGLNPRWFVQRERKTKVVKISANDLNAGGLTRSDLHKAQEEKPKDWIVDATTFGRSDTQGAFNWVYHSDSD
jgi:hypothetical protein